MHPVPPKGVPPKTKDQKQPSKKQLNLPKTIKVTTKFLTCSKSAK